jgi:hypothetical protein
MKTKILLSIVLSILMIPAFSQEKTDQPGKKEQIEMLVNSREFVFHARRAMPSHGSSIDLISNPNYVKFKPDFIEGSMPFFGRAYSGVGYGDEGGLRFSGQPEQFNVEKTKKNYEITATVKGESDNYRLSLSVAPEGSASLVIISNNRESISYIGEISEK